jgi:RNase P/RNase MRP subunit p30
MNIINTQNLNQARKEIQKIKKENPSEAIVVKAQNEEFNRKILEIPGVNVLLSPELHYRKDMLKQRDSGLNEFLCKLAAKNNVKIAIDIVSLSKLDKKDKEKALARIKQNITLAKKTGCQIILWPENKFNKLDIMGFLIAMGASTELAKRSTLSNN